MEHCAPVGSAFHRRPYHPAPVGSAFHRRPHHPAPVGRARRARRITNRPQQTRNWVMELFHNLVVYSAQFTERLSVARISVRLSHGLIETLQILSPTISRMAQTRIRRGRRYHSPICQTDACIRRASCCRPCMSRGFSGFSEQSALMPLNILIAVR